MLALMPSHSPEAYRRHPLRLALEIALNNIATDNNSELLDADHLIRGGADHLIRGDDVLRHERSSHTQALKPAAVLIAFFERTDSHDGPQILLTQRTSHLHDHAGQISFPGGRVDAGDANAIATATREAHEETGLAPAHGTILGQLPAYRTGSGYKVNPVVTWVHSPDALLALQADPFEVADLFFVPAHFVLNAANQRQETAFFRGHERSYWAIPWREPKVAPTTHPIVPITPKLRYIWGVTAGILVTLSRVLEGFEQGPSASRK
jgi:8-oxo-dGTP pyrophosphatase MutT (NUDIX family)